MEKLKAAVVGLGRMGGEPSTRLEGKVPNGWLPISHAEAILNTPNLKLEAICDNDHERIAKLSEYYSVKNIYNDYKKLIKEIKPYFLSIATRTQGRVDIIKFGVDNGCSVIYFEKPISNSILETKSILNYALSNNVVIGYGVNRRYHASYRKARDIIRSGELGKVEHICIEHNLANLLWAHPHSVDLILFFAESCDLEYIQGNCSYVNDYIPISPLEIDNDPIVNSAYFKFKNGITASISSARGLNTRISCEKGILTIYSDGDWIEVNTKKETGYLTRPQIIEVDTLQSATVTAFKELMDVSINKDFKKYPITDSEILTGMIMLHGIVYSSFKGCIQIKPTDVPEEMMITGKMGIWYA